MKMGDLQAKAQEKFSLFAKDVSVMTHDYGTEPGIEDLKKENEALQQKIKLLEAEKEDLRRKDALDEMIAKAQAELINRVKNIGTLIMAGLAVVGFTSFSSLVNNVSQRVNETATADIIKQVKKDATKQIQASVSKSLSDDFKKDAEFRTALVDALAKDEKLRDSVISDPVLQDKIQAEVTIAVRSKLIAASDDLKKKAIQNPAVSDGGLAQSIEDVYQKETYFVVSGSSEDPQDLERDVKGKALSNGFNARICSPKPGNKRSALTVSDKPILLLPYDQAIKVRDKARKTIQSDAYVLSQKTAFFNCN